MRPDRGSEIEVGEYIAADDDHPVIEDQVTGVANGTRRAVVGIGAEEVLKVAELAHAQNKFIKHYSSGMKQRLKLALAILADTPLLLLDEPLSNLDRQGFDWYGEMIAGKASGKTILVCSNTVPEEYAFCDRNVRMGDYKK